MSIIEIQSADSKVNYCVKVGNPKDRLALAHAKFRGYELLLVGDG